MAEHPLQAHVLRLARRLHLAGVVIVQHAVVAPRDRDRRVPALADVDDFRLAELSGGIAAVRHEDAGHGMDAQRHERRDERAARRTRAVDTFSCHSRSRPDSAATPTSTCCECWLPRPKPMHHAGAERADNRAERVRGVDAADQPRRVVVSRHDRGEREREAGAPENRAGQHGEQAADEIELELEPRVVEIDGLIGQYGSDCVSA